LWGRGRRVWLSRMKRVRRRSLGRVGTWEEAKKALYGRIQALLGKYGKFTGVAIHALPMSDEEAGMR